MLLIKQPLGQTLLLLRQSHSLSCLYKAGRAFDRRSSEEHGIEVLNMSHRFPIEEAVFPPLRLSESAKDKFNNTASTHLTMALREYDKYRSWQLSRPPNLRYQLHPAMWKPIKTCEQLTVYRKVLVDDSMAAVPAEGLRRRAYSRSLDALRLERAIDSVSSTTKESVTGFSWSEDRTSSSEWNMPTLLQVGTIEGTLDDIMYSSVSFDALGTLIESMYTTEDIVDAETLYELESPTKEEPFRFRGIKWVVKSTPSTVKAFLWPRDLLFLAATGTLNRPDGERVGYHLMHSIDLGKGFGPLDGKRIVRGRVSSCYFYRQNSPNTVDVYMKTNFDPNGLVHESVALLSAATSLTRCIKSSLCAQNKKLSWLLAHPTTNEMEAGSARPNNVRAKKRNDCSVCTRSIGAFSRCYSCRVCNARVCSTCCVKKKLGFPGPAYKTVEQRVIIVCTHCLTYVRKLNASEIAEQDVKERQHLNQRNGFVQGAQVLSRNNRSNSRPEVNRQRRGTIAERATNEQDSKDSDDEKVFLTAPGRTNRTLYQFDFDDLTVQSSTLKNNDVSGVVLLPLAPEPSQTRTKAMKSRSNSQQMGSITSKSKPDVLSMKVNKKESTDCFVKDSVEMSMQQDVPVLDNALPTAEVQYAWGEVVPSPTNNNLSETLTPPIKKMENMWSSGEEQSATPSILQPTSIPRIHAGASAQEVLAQFAELCNAAENVLQAARKHTITVLDPTMLTCQQNTRFDMSAVD
ncbi:Zinc finger, RING/FYVE/PHD-type [Plasmopara halstedii]|uniref:Zinc finger, RING/FYVE/PHD-type n=1 Tax=Plasmopara halstedii TaxID=4781 RepID=A0A0P1AWY8_PLAHL|nr:Zinc finger, RING/FYVE/PHD-type [Plasmopara halstedii]CEG45274.1 Zinc finger, RING/FYVE/PHD-type [Plasmopara halstedii]|eukprot:XP_024581643.1 Zinc finger, RING/FYVE/PHD-type [Plasmopara halstedii]